MVGNSVHTYLLTLIRNSNNVISVLHYNNQILISHKFEKAYSIHKKKNM